MSKDEWILIHVFYHKEIFPPQIVLLRCGMRVFLFHVMLWFYKSLMIGAEHLFQSYCWYLHVVLLVFTFTCCCYVWIYPLCWHLPIVLTSCVPKFTIYLLCYHVHVVVCCVGILDIVLACCDHGDGICLLGFDSPVVFCVLVFTCRCVGVVFCTLCW